MESEYNKIIIDIDSSNVVFNGNNCDFYADILQPLKNVKCLKLIRSSVTIKPKQEVAGSRIYNDDDPIYVDVNGYNRVLSVVNGSPLKCFEMLLVSLTKTYSIVNSADFTNTSQLTYMNEYTHSFQEDDISVHVLKPIEPNLKRFNIKLYDKNHIIIPKANVSHFKMILCAYSLKNGYI